MRQRHWFSSVSFLAWLGLAAAVGCDAPSNNIDTSAREAALAACHLTDAGVDPTADLRACDPSDVKKTTICHIPPGNPANAHTLCVGNAAVPAHLQNHGDYLGACKAETPCPPPPSGSGGATGGGAAGAPGDGSGGASGGSAGGAPGAADAGITIVP